MRALWVLTCAVAVACVILVPTLVCVAIWVGSGRLGGIAGVLAFVAIGMSALASVWTTDFKPAKRLPRTQRRELRDAEARIAVAAEIKRMEKEAGL